MASYGTNEFRSGLKIILNGDPYVIVDNEFVKPGKGQAFNRVRIRNLKSGRTLERNFRSGESVEAGGDLSRWSLEVRREQKGLFCTLGPEADDSTVHGALFAQLDDTEVENTGGPELESA